MVLMTLLKPMYFDSSYFYYKADIYCAEYEATYNLWSTITKFLKLLLHDVIKTTNKKIRFQ